MRIQPTATSQSFGFCLAKSLRSSHVRKTCAKFTSLSFLCRRSFNCALMVMLCVGAERTGVQTLKFFESALKKWNISAAAEEAAQHRINWSKAVLSSQMYRINWCNKISKKKSTGIAGVKQRNGHRVCDKFFAGPVYKPKHKR